MDYRLDMGMWNQVFAVPCALVDRHLKLAGKEQLQAILWMLRFAGQGFTPEAMAESLGMSLDSARDALDYWCDRGLLCADGGLLTPVPQREPEASPLPPPAPSEPAGASSVPPAEPAPDPAPARVLPPQKRLIRPDGEHLAARMAESENMRFLLQEAEAILGRTLSPAMSSTLMTVTDDYGLPVEVTVMLLRYAVDAGHAGTSYIDSVARDWAQSGIFSIEAAEEKLQALSRERLAWQRVSAAAGLIRRSPSKKEAERACRWVYAWNFSDEMLACAYDACAEHTGKFSAAYMDKVLTGWHDKGIQTPEEVESAREQVKEEEKSSKSYDIDELMEISSLDLRENL